MNKGEFAWSGLRLTLVLCAVILALPMQPASADIGPKPNMVFYLDFKDTQAVLVEGSLIECNDQDCLEGKPLQNLGPQHFSCTDTICQTSAYRYADYHKLVITFEDRTRESNVFKFNGLSQSYNVKVLADSLMVEAKPSDLSKLCCCCGSSGALTMVVETLLAALFLSSAGLSRALLGWVPIASLITLPFVWWVFPLVGLPTGWTTGLAEVFAFGVEAVFLYVVTGGRISLRRALLLSFLMNSVSFAVGLLV